MIREIIKNDISGTAILTQTSEKVEKGENISDLIRDLIDTAKSHTDPECAGLAAIQIGVPKRVCVMVDGDKYIPIINPFIIQRSKGTHMSTEVCLSVEGERTIKRHNEVIAMIDVGGKRKKRVFGGIHSVILQHEMDHMNGLLV